MATGSTWRQSPSGTESFGGTFFHGGNVAAHKGDASPNTLAPGNDIVQANQPFTNADTTKHIAANDFANQLAGKYSIQHGGSTQEYLGAIAGVAQANETLLGGAGHPKYVRDVNAIEAFGPNPMTATAIRAGNWEDFTGSFSSGPTSSASGINLSLEKDIVASAGSDHAASGLHNGSNYMGKLTIHHGSLGKPTNQYYQGKQLGSETQRGG